MDMEHMRPNALKNRDKLSIDQIETSFSSGLLRSALERSPELERRYGLTPEQFYQDFRKNLRPVVIEGLLEHWPALKRWNLDYLVSKCSNASVVVDSYNSKKAYSTSFDNFIKILQNNEGIGSEPIYLQEWLYRTDCAFLADDMPELDIAQYDFRQKIYGAEIAANHQLWIGQKGATTRVHQDSYLVDVMHAQISGEKLWCVMSPDAHLDCDDSGIMNFADLIDNPRTRIMHCVLRPGDVIYLPALWWHRIKLLSNSIGLGRKCLDETNVKEHLRLRLGELLALALNHDAVKAAHPELYKVVMLRNQAWAKLLKIDLMKLRA